MPLNTTSKFESKFSVAKSFQFTVFNLAAAQVYKIKLFLSSCEPIRNKCSED